MAGDRSIFNKLPVTVYIGNGHGYKIKGNVKPVDGKAKNAAISIKQQNGCKHTD